MKIFGLEIKKTKQFEPVRKDLKADYYGDVVTSHSVPFDGEKSANELGPAFNYEMQYDKLRVRSWQLYVESDIAKTVLDKFTLWMVDKGLKLQCQPDKLIIREKHPNFDSEKFNESVEARFNNWMKSKRSSHNKMKSGNQLSKIAFKNSKIGGDVLVIMRVENGTPTIQIIDGCHLRSTSLSVGLNGNRVINGVEIDKTGKHIRYWVRKKNGQFQKIKAWNKSGIRQAFLVYGDEHRLNDVRGVPLIMTSMETIKKMDRYKEAVIGSAEEREKIAFFLEHNQFSSGENPFGGAIADMTGISDQPGQLATDQQGKEVARQVAATTNKQAINLPVGSTIKSVESKTELYFKEFHGTMTETICSAVGIPPNVALSLYNDSYSASRAATKDWEHTMSVVRDEYGNGYYHNIFSFWFHVMVLNGRISSDGYLSAFANNDTEMIDAFLNSRFTGPNFPHIDPLKEVQAERAKLGPLANNIPLTTVESAVENLGELDSVSIAEQFATEKTSFDSQLDISETPDEV